MSDAQKIDVVEYVFKRLSATYGAAWDRSLGQAPIADVMTVWGYQLQQFTQSTSAKKMIMWALDNLPDRCPNVIEFKTLCRRAPVTMSVALPEAKADPQRVGQELAKLNEIKSKAIQTVGMKDWAHHLKARHESGEMLNMNQRRCMNEALKNG